MLRINFLTVSTIAVALYLFPVTVSAELVIELEGTPGSTAITIRGFGSGTSTFTGVAFRLREDGFGTTFGEVNGTDHLRNDIQNSENFVIPLTGNFRSLVNGADAVTPSSLRIEEETPGTGFTSFFPFTFGTFPGALSGDTLGLAGVSTAILPLPIDAIFNPGVYNSAVYGGGLSNQYRIIFSAVPEPSSLSLSLLMVGIAAIALNSRRRCTTNRTLQIKD